MSHFSSLLTNSPFTVFLAVLLGVLVGRIEYRGFSLGSSGTLFASLGLGFLGFRVDHGYLSLSLVLFIATVGLLASENIGGALSAHGVKFVVIGAVMTGTGAAIAGLMAAIFPHRIDPWLLRASFVGTLTSSPGLAAAITATGTEEVGASYAATYPFALLGMVVFSKILVLAV